MAYKQPYVFQPIVAIDGPFKTVFYVFVEAVKQPRNFLKIHTSTRILQCKNTTQEHIFLAKEARCFYAVTVVHGDLLCCMYVSLSGFISGNELCLFSP